MLYKLNLSPYKLILSLLFPAAIIVMAAVNYYKFGIDGIIAYDSIFRKWEEDQFFKYKFIFGISCLFVWLRNYTIPAIIAALNDFLPFKIERDGILLSSKKFIPLSKIEKIVTSKFWSRSVYLILVDGKKINLRTSLSNENDILNIINAINDCLPRNN